MSVTQPNPVPTVEVAYSSPFNRALDAAQRHAMANVIAAVITALLVGLQQFLTQGNFTRAAAVSAATALLVTILGIVIAGLTKYVSALE